MSIEPQAFKQARTWKHDRQLTCCQFAPDGASVIAAGHDGQLHRLHLEGDDRQTLPAHRGWVEGLRWTADRTLLVSADSWGQVCGWKWSERGLAEQPAWTIARACGSWLRDLAISPDGKLLATCGNEPVVRVFATSDGRLVHELRGHEQRVMSVAFAPDSKRLVSGDLMGQIRDWNLETGQCHRQLSATRLFKTYYQYRQGGVRGLAFGADGKLLYCGGFEGTNANQAQGNPLVLVIDWASGQLTATLTPNPTLNGPIMDLGVHPAGWLIASGSSEGGGTLWIWRLGEDKNAHHHKHSTSFRRFAISPDGTRLAAASFGDLDGQRGGNGRRLDKDGNYPDFGGTLVLYQWS